MGSEMCIRDSPYTKPLPAAAGVADGFVVAWQKGSFCASYPRCFDVDATGVRNDGSVTPTLTIAASPQPETSPTVVGLADGTAAVLYARVSPEKPYGGVNRIFQRVVSLVGRSRGVRRN